MGCKVFHCRQKQIDISHLLVTVMWNNSQVLLLETVHESLPPHNQTECCLYDVHTAWPEFVIVLHKKKYTFETSTNTIYEVLTFA
jgi:hypothetical protein